MKRLLVLIGIMTVAVAIYLWNGGLSPALSTLVMQWKQATAAKTAAFKIRLAKNEAASLEVEEQKAKKEYEYQKIQYDRELEVVEKGRVCLKELAGILTKAGGPKASELHKLSPKIKKKRVIFLGHELSVEGAYVQLIELYKEYEGKRRILEDKKALIESLEKYVKQLSTIREDLLTNAEKLEITLQKMETERQIAILEAKSSELAASSGGSYYDIDKNLETLQESIDRAKAQTMAAQSVKTRVKIVDLNDSNCDTPIDSFFE